MSTRIDRRAEDLAARAIALWIVVDRVASAPDSVDVLKPPHRKSAVLRLVGAGPDGQSVVAKRAARASIEIEARVYRDVLARLPVSATRLLGTAADGDRSWLFLEDAGDKPFEPGLAAHRSLAAAWMARVHEGARLLPQVEELPDRGPSHYRALLRDVEALLRETLGNAALSAEEIAVVEGLLETCDVLGSRWPDVGVALAGAPSTITFGGFSNKNARVRASADGPVLMPFDFESAGYGCRAIDLAYLDGDTYVQVASEWWSGLDISEFDRLRGIGRVLGGLKAIPGEREVLLAESPSKAVAKLHWYGREIVEGMSAAGLDGGETPTLGRGVRSEA